MMKTLHIIVAILLLPLLAFAQIRVNASDVLAKINRGEAVSYKNAEIIGDLDMTRLKNMKLKSNRSENNSKEYLSVVTVPLTFINCAFKGEVRAYFNPSNGVNIGRAVNEVYNTNFEKEVRFENCNFARESAFKYSEFKRGASFSGSRFAEEALFKYSEFSDRADFSNVKFGDDANFKYVDFPMMANFSGARFTDEANFKYTKFLKGANFQGAVFEELANFKYAKISDPFNIKGATFNGDEDFKYTKLNNRSVTFSSLLDESR